jgi:hypothetical protein
VPKKERKERARDLLEDRLEKYLIPEDLTVPAKIMIILYSPL